ncbi:MAG TPA: hypothetical protein VEN81_15675, partial [Planctomycetota bacterium]|nr:hypothetical protein [Planctomycetota bacterium]
MLPGAPPPVQEAELLRKLAGDDEKEQAEAADALVRKGLSGRVLVAKAWEKAPAAKKARYED